MRKVLYLSLKEFRSAQKRQLEDGSTNPNGKLAHTPDIQQLKILQKVKFTLIRMNCIPPVSLQQLKDMFEYRLLDGFNVRVAPHSFNCRLQFSVFSSTTESHFNSTRRKYNEARRWRTLVFVVGQWAASCILKGTLELKVFLIYFKYCLHIKRRNTGRPLRNKHKKLCRSEPFFSLGIYRLITG